MMAPELKAYINHLREELRPLLERVSHAVPDHPPGFRSATVSYLDRDGKLLRPALVCLSAAACGGEEARLRALPVAAAVEVLHVMTLVHDDIIDDDAERRGSPSVHEIFRQSAVRELGLSASEARAYGKNLALLSGDVLHAAAVWLLSERARIYQLPEQTLSLLIQRMESETFPALISGQALDVYLSAVSVDAVLKWPAEQLEQAARRVMSLKTASLLAFAAAAGALVGTAAVSWSHPWVETLEAFASRCGLAFQIIDDILGVELDSAALGKPSGSDLREGKKTLLLARVLQELPPERRELIRKYYGRRRVSAAEIELVRRAFTESRAIISLRQEAEAEVKQAEENLAVLPASRYTTLLKYWAQYLVSRGR